MRIKDEVKELKPIGDLDTAYPFAYYASWPGNEPGSAGSVTYGMVTADMMDDDGMVTAVDMRSGKRFRLYGSTLVEPLPKAVFLPYGEKGQKISKEGDAE